MGLSVRETMTFLKLWNLPTLLLNALVNLALMNACNVLFGFNNWGVTVHQLSQHPDMEGQSLLQPQGLMQ